MPWFTLDGPPNDSQKIFKRSMGYILLLGLSLFPLTLRANGTLPAYTLDITQVALGSVCTTLRVTPFTNPCNPAYASLQRESFFLGNIFLGDNYSTVREFQQLADQQRYQDLMERIYLEDRDITMQSASTLYFVGHNFNVTLSPERLFYGSRSYNPTYPTYDIQIVKEQSIAMQFGFNWADEWAWGLQTRMVSRQYHIGSFALFDALTEGSNVFHTAQQQAIFVEPGLTYISKQPWHPRWSLFLSNTGLGSHHERGVEFNPVVEMGAGFETPMAYWGRFEFGATYRWSDRELFFDDDPWRVGGIYEIGLVNATFGWGSQRRSLGVISSFQKFRVGLLYESRKVITNLGNESYEDMVSTEFGLLL